MLLRANFGTRALLARTSPTRENSKLCDVLYPSYSPYAYRIERSTRSPVPCTAWIKRRQLARQPGGMGGSLLRSQSCDFHMAAWIHGRHIVVSNCEFSVLTGPMCSAMFL